MVSFRTWLEQIAPSDDVQAAILAALPDELQGSEHDSEQLLASKTTDFGADTLQRIRQLGLITNIKDDNPNLWQNILHSIDNGITIRELIGKINGSEIQAIPQTATPPDTSNNPPELTTHQS